MWIQEKKSSNNKEQAKPFYLEGRKIQAVRPQNWDMFYFFRHCRKIVAGTLVTISKHKNANIICRLDTYVKMT